MLLDFFKRLFNEEEPDPMKYLIVGLGNMGAEYDDTRHNIGFDVLDHLAEAAEIEFKNDRLGDVARFKHRGRTFVLVKPSTYMNLSGKAVQYWMTKEKVKATNLLVVVDDLNIDLGKLRLRGKGSDGGHNGLKHINQVLGNTKYARLRMGIGNQFSKGKQIDFVLGKWKDEERETVNKMIKKAGDTVKSFGAIGLAHTMSQFNG
ncbi:MAG: aminoacyl-tRNA hydrolase [Bacteroidota bacterium]